MTIASGHSNLTKGRIAAAHGWFNGIQQVAPVCTPTSFSGPTRVPIRNSISIGSAVFAQLTAGLPCALNEPPSPQNFIFPSEPITQTASRSVQPFCTAHRTSQWAAPSLQNYSFPRGIWTPSPHLMHDSVGPLGSSTQTTSRSVQPFLKGRLLLQTNRLTDRRTDHATRSIAIGRICVYVVLRCGLIIYY